MSDGPEKKSSHRVAFTREVPVRIQAIDGTWSRKCLMLDVADDGAKLLLEESVGSLRLSEFFLVLSTTGSAFRLCELSWMNGDEMGVQFVEKVFPELPGEADSDQDTHEV
jgi:hypothetical protein